MRVLLDTHILIWWLRDDPRLGPKAKALIASSEVSTLVSVATFWEVAVKWRTGKMAELASQLWQEAEFAGFQVLPITRDHLVTLENLASLKNHGDPFDRLLVAQSICEDAALMTGDRTLLAEDIRALRPK